MRGRFALVVFMDEAGHFEPVASSNVPDHETDEQTIERARSLLRHLEREGELSVRWPVTVAAFNRDVPISDAAFEAWIESDDDAA